MFFFFCGPFLLVPRVIGFQKIFCCRPRVCKVFFFVALRWAPRPFGGARAKKKKTPPRVFFFLLRPRGKAGEGEARAQRGFSFPCLSPGPEQKKKTPWVVLFFLLWPRAGAQRGFSFPCLSPGPQQKKKNTLGGVFFFCSGPVPAPNGASPSRAFRRGRSKKQKYPGWCFFFAAAPRGRSLTHCGPGWRCLPLGGVVFFFLLRPRPDRGGVLFFCCGPARTLTHSRWAGAISARPGWCFVFCCGPAGSF